MKTVMKIVAAGVILMIIAIAGCTALVGAGADQAAKAINKSQQRDTAQAQAFAHKFAKVKVGDTITGAGGMTFAQVRALLGKPKPGDVTQTKSSGMTLTTWSYTYLMSNGSSIFSVDFTNGHTSGKSRA